MDVVVVPSTPALLPENAGLADPVADLRAACADAVGWLAGRHPDRVAVLAAPARADNRARGVVVSSGERVARSLLEASGFTGAVDLDPTAGAAAVVVVANGTATRSERAPGFLDERAFAFDEAVGTALDMGDPEVLRVLDADLGAALWCHDVPALRALGALVPGPVSATMTYADDPYGVQYWVVRWTCGS